MGVGQVFAVYRGSYQDRLGSRSTSSLHLKTCQSKYSFKEESTLSLYRSAGGKEVFTGKSHTTRGRWGRNTFAKCAVTEGRVGWEGGQLRV